MLTLLSGYGCDARDRQILGDLEYIGPVEFSHGDWHLIARVQKRSEDGADAEIHECRLPARFFKLAVKPYPDSVGEMHAGFEMSTGSGDEMGKLVVALAKAVAGGMIGVDLLIEPKAK